MNLILKRFILLYLLGLSFLHPAESQEISKDFLNPPGEFSVMPFWFWNDTLKDEEIIRQIAGFEAHGVYGFVIHPRIGLPENIGWLSPEMIHAMSVAIKEAARRLIHDRYAKLLSFAKPPGYLTSQQKYYIRINAILITLRYNICEKRQRLIKRGYTLQE